MYIESHAVICPLCDGHRYIGHLLCTECLGDGKIVFQQRKAPMHLTGKQLWVGFWQILMWVLLAAGTVAAFARRMGWL